MADTPSWKPKCPNHGAALEGCGFPLPKKGTGKCPVSGVDFDFEVEIDDDEMKQGVKKDKDGKIIKEMNWKVTGDESGHGSVDGSYQ